MFDYAGRDWPSANCERIEGLAALSDRILAAGDGPARISYRGELSSKHFGIWSSVALAWAQLASGNSAAAKTEAQRALTMSEEMDYHWGKVDAEEVLEKIGAT